MVRLTDRPDMTLDVYRGRTTTIQQQLNIPLNMSYQNLVIKILWYVPWYVSYQEFINQDFTVIAMVNKLSEFYNQDFSVCTMVHELSRFYCKCHDK